jgi:hydrogenase nickel incorporation protein HypB
LPYVDFDVDQFGRFAREINPQLTIFKTSAKTGDGVDEWLAWLRQHVGT